MMQTGYGGLANWEMWGWCYAYVTGYAGLAKRGMWGWCYAYSNHRTKRQNKAHHKVGK